MQKLIKSLSSSLIDADEIRLTSLLIEESKRIVLVYRHKDTRWSSANWVFLGWRKTRLLAIT
jgi:hypothetical protein